MSPTTPTLTRRQARWLDEQATSEYGLPSIVLMENAGRGVADFVCGLNPGGAARGLVVVCCGKGNNGGDGFVVARHLDLRGVPVKVLLFADPDELTGDAAVNFRAIERADVPIVRFDRQPDAARLDAELTPATWIIDALLGTGASGSPRPPYDVAIERINAAQKPVVAVDLPSGLDCDTGQPGQPTIRASLTCAMVAAKPGFFAPGASAFTGQVHLIDIGAPRKLASEALASPR